jgi:hypothetical protein
VRCAVICDKFVWLFNASNKKQGREIANLVIFYEKLGQKGPVSGFSVKNGWWEAVPIEKDKTQNLIEKTDKSKIIEIKRKRAPVIDALYVTRLQKERWGDKK